MLPQLDRLSSSDKSTQFTLSGLADLAGVPSVVAGAIFHKTACAIAVQNEVRVQSEYSIDALGTKVVSDLLYGVKILDDSDNIKGVALANI